MHQAPCALKRMQLPACYIRIRTSTQRSLERRSWLGFSWEGFHFSVVRQGGPYRSVPRRLMAPARHAQGCHQLLEGPGPREQSPEGGLAPEALV